MHCFGVRRTSANNALTLRHGGAGREQSSTEGKGFDVRFRDVVSANTLYAIPCEHFESKKFRENLGYKSFVYDIIVVRKVKKVKN